MDINIIAGKCSELNNKYIFNLLKNRERTKKHIIIAPDRSLFSIEQRLFDELNESCFFDISVTSISKLSKSLLINNNQKHILTKQSGVALVKKLLKDNIDKLCTFKKSTSYMGFATTLFETICLFKSCNISCNDVYVDDSTSHLNLKQKDIKLIYTEYEKFLQQDYTDSFNQLRLFADLIDKDFCKNTIFYFVEFDDFTSLMYSIIEKLAKFSEKFYICTSFGKYNNNSNIYSNKVYYDLISLFKSNGLVFNINKIEASDNLIDNILLNNLLSYNIIDRFDGENNKFKITSFENITDEVKYAISDIYQKVLNNKHLTFSNFAIILPNINDYLSIIKRELGKYQIPYFVDKNDNLSSHVLIRTLFDTCKIVAGDFVVSDFTNLIKSDILCFDLDNINEYDNALHRIGVKGFECLNLNLINDDELTFFVDLIISLRRKSKEQINWKYYYENIVLPIYDYLIDKSQNYIKKIDALDLRIFEQVITKFESINKDFISVFSNSESTFDDFVETYYSYFESTNISLPPITSNTLMIADFNSSYLSIYAHMYIFGCNEGHLPKFKLDNGLITDEEISLLPNSHKINPTIAMLNTRKTFKLFELVFKAKTSLNLSYLTNNVQGKLFPNNLIISLMKILNIKVINGSTKLDLINNSFFDINIDNIIFNNLCNNISIENVLSLLRNWETYKNNLNYRQILSTLVNVNESVYLGKLINNLTFTDKYNNLKAVNMFKNNTTSVSQIETYFNCPYMHFAKYGLRLNKKQEYKIQANDVGTIIHAVLKEIMPHLMQNLDNLEYVITESKSVLSKLLETDDYKVISKNPINAYIIKSLYKELERVCAAVVNEIKFSTFKPSLKHLEYNFNPNNLMVDNIKIRGSIDRVDTNADNFIIIDYKTGDNSFDNYNDVYSGKKLQLLVYAKAFQNETNKKLKGIYYFPLSNSFTKNDSPSYRFNGITYKSKENIIAMDNNLVNPNYKSKIINITTSKNGDFYKNNYYNYLCLEQEDLDYLLNFAMKQVEQAIKNIMLGNISPNPIRQANKKACQYCDYKGLCNYLNNNDHLEVKISSIEELKTKEKNNGTRAE